MMGFPLVVGVDGSRSSLQAVDEAACHGLPLCLVHASLWERYEGRRPSFTTDRPAEEVMADHIIASCAERARLRNPQVKVSGDVLPDDAASALLRDSSERSAAVRFAVREAEARGCALEAVRAWRSPAHEHVDHPPPDFAQGEGGAARVYGEQALAHLTDALREAEREHAQVDVHRKPVEGAAHKVLLEASADADLIVVGALRRHGHFGLQFGRTTCALLHHSACPVAVVPRPA